jgi:hypothetical protein
MLSPRKNAVSRFDVCAIYQEQCDIAAKEVLQALDDFLNEKFSVVPQQLIPPRHQQ